MRIVLAAFVAVTLGTCAHAEPLTNEPVCTAGWTVSAFARGPAELWDQLFAAAVPSIDDLNNFHREYGYPVPALTGPGWVVGDWTSMPWLSGPCGEVILPFVENLLEALDAFQPRFKAALDFMTEIDGSGRILAQWQVPRGSRLRGVREKEILVGVPLRPICEASLLASEPPRESVLAIRADGKFRVVRIQEQGPWPTSEACIVVAPYDPEFEARCWKLTDPTSGKSRKIARISTCH